MQDQEETSDNGNKTSSTITDVTKIDLLEQLTEIEDEIERENNNISMEYEKLRRLDYDVKGNRWRSSMYGSEGSSRRSSSVYGSQGSSRRSSSVYGSQGSNWRSSAYSSQGYSRRPSQYSDLQFQELEMESTLQEQLLQEADFFTKAFPRRAFPSYVANPLSKNVQR